MCKQFCGRLRVHPDNGRYFTDDSGRAIYLTGSHTWANLQDIGLPGGPPPLHRVSGLDGVVQSQFYALLDVRAAGRRIVDACVHHL